tara:strand:+ start:2574 stop:2816 length:243 start_codon:yes stop_codon:yes gene_type:complete
MEKIEIPINHWHSLADEIEEMVRIFLDDVEVNINDFEPDFEILENNEVAIKSINFGITHKELLTDLLLSKYFKIKNSDES